MDAPSLTSVPSGWWVTLRSGGTVDIAAHGAKETDSLLVFVVLAKGQPNFELAVAAFPMDEVQDWGGGHEYDGTFLASDRYRCFEAREQCRRGADRTCKARRMR